MSLNKKPLCGGKVIYSTFNAGERGMKNLIRYKDERNLHVYPCPDCMKFHVGHITQRAINKNRQRRQAKSYKREKGVKHENTSRAL